MNTQTIKINQTKLNRIINESINKILKEEGERECGYEPIRSIIKQLINITSSNYIPFTSPSPSSTEMIIKKNVMKAIECLKTAYDTSCQLNKFGR